MVGNIFLDKLAPSGFSIENNMRIFFPSMFFFHHRINVRVLGTRSTDARLFGLNINMIDIWVCELPPKIEYKWVNIGINSISVNLHAINRHRA